MVCALPGEPPGRPHHTPYIHNNDTYSNNNTTSVGASPCVKTLVAPLVPCGLYRVQAPYLAMPLGRGETLQSGSYLNSETVRRFDASCQPIYMQWCSKWYNVLSCG